MLRSMNITRALGLGLAAASAALACACQATPVAHGATVSVTPASPSAATPPAFPGAADADSDGMDTLAELRQLETTVPAHSERQPRPAGEGPVAFVPRAVTHEVTATVVVREEPGGAILSRETFRISPERLSVTDDAGAEWWLARNPLHPDELSGAQCNPAERLVLDHNPGDLRLIGCEDMWDRIACLGSRGATTEGLQPTGKVESAFGLDFEQWVAADDASPIRELWWNATEGWALRARAVVDGRSMVREIASLDWSVDSSALADPIARHPGWLRSEISDLEDMREDSAGHGTP